MMIESLAPQVENSTQISNYRMWSITIGCITVPRIQIFGYTTTIEWRFQSNKLYYRYDVVIQELDYLHSGWFISRDKQEEEIS